MSALADETIMQRHPPHSVQPVDALRNNESIAAALPQGFTLCSFAGASSTAVQVVYAVCIPTLIA